MRARFHELAQREFSDATEFYRRESGRLAARFVNAVERVVQALLATPQADDREYLEALLAGRL